MSFGKRLNEERKRINLNQTEFGKIGGVTKTSQLNYEASERSPSADYWKAISNIGVDVQYILTGTRTNESSLHKQQVTNELDNARLMLAIETVEEGLQVTNRTMQPEKKAELILAVYDLFNDDQTPEMKTNILKLVRSAA